MPQSPAFYWPRFVSGCAATAAVSLLAAMSACRRSTTADASLTTRSGTVDSEAPVHSQRAIDASAGPLHIEPSGAMDAARPAIDAGPAIDDQAFRDGVLIPLHDGAAWIYVKRAWPGFDVLAWRFDVDGRRGPLPVRLLHVRGDPVDSMLQSEPGPALAADQRNGHAWIAVAWVAPDRAQLVHFSAYALAGNLTHVSQRIDYFEQDTNHADGASVSVVAGDDGSAFFHSMFFPRSGDVSNVQWMLYQLGHDHVADSATWPRTANLEYPEADLSVNLLWTGTRAHYFVWQHASPDAGTPEQSQQFAGWVTSNGDDAGVEQQQQVACDSQIGPVAQAWNGHTLVQWLSVAADTDGGGARRDIVRVSDSFGATVDHTLSRVTAACVAGHPTVQIAWEGGGDSFDVALPTVGLSFGDFAQRAGVPGARAHMVWTGRVFLSATSGTFDRWICSAADGPIIHIDATGTVLHDRDD